jgi:ATP-dependent Clp protease protease subunit
MPTTPMTAPVPAPAGSPLPTPIHYISFVGDNNTPNAQRLLDAAVKEVQAGAKSLYLILNTMGGEVATGIAIFNLLKGLPCHVVTHNAASVNSIGNVVFLAGKTRYACANASFMFHGVGVEIRQGVRLEQKNTKEILGGLEADTRRMAHIIETCANFPSQAEIEKLFVEASTKDAAYAKQHGIVHDVKDIAVPSGSRLVQLVL